MLKNLKLSQKVTVAFCFLMVITFLITLVGYIGMRNITGNVDELAKTQMPSINNLFIMSNLQKDMLIGEHGLINRRMTESDLRKEHYAGINASYQKAEEAKKNYNEIKKLSNHETLWKIAINQWNEWQKAHKQVIDLSLEKDKMLASGMNINSPQISQIDSEAFKAFMTSRQLYITSNTTLKTLMDENLKLSEQELQKADGVVLTSLIILIVSFIIALIIAVLFSVFFSKNISGIIGDLLKETDNLIKEIMAGNLSTRAKTEKINFEFREIAKGFNDTLDSIIGPLNVAAEYIDRISKGDIPPKITEQYNGDFNEIKNNLNVCIDSITLMGNDVRKLCIAAFQGDFYTRVEASRHQGMFSKIIQGIDDVMNTLVGYINIIPVPAMILDKEFSIKYINQAGINLMGLTKEFIIGTRCYDLLKTTDCRSATCACSRVIQTGNPETHETIANIGGRELEIHYSGVPIKDKEGKVIGVFEIINDQTEIKKVAKLAQKMSDFQSGEVAKLSQALHKLSMGDLNIDLTLTEGDSDTIGIQKNFELIHKSINEAVIAIKALVDDALSLTKAAVKGQLSVRAESIKHNGEFRRIIEGVNDTLDSIIGPLNVAAEYIDRISKGNIPPKITEQYNGDFNEIKNNLNMCIDSFTMMGGDVRTLCIAAFQGDFYTRVDASRHQGMFSKIIQGMDDVMNTLVGYINIIPVPAMILDKEFRIKYINYAGITLIGLTKELIIGTKCYDHLKTRDCNTADCTCTQILQTGIPEAHDTIANIAGKEMEIHYSGVPIKDKDNKVIGVFEIINDQTEIKKVAKLAQKISDFQAKEIDKLSEALHKLSMGDLNIELNLIEGDSDTIGVQKNFEVIHKSINEAVIAIKALVEDALSLTKAAVKGQLSVRAESIKHNGEFRKIIEGVNSTLDSIIGPLNVAAEYIDRISKGDIPPKVTDNYNGDFNEIKNNLNMCIDSFTVMGGDVRTICIAAFQGDFYTRVDASKHQGMFGKIIQGIDDVMNTLVGYINIIPVPSMILDKDFSIKYINQAGMNMIGLPKNLIIGTKCHDHFKTKDCRSSDCACGKVIQTGNAEAHETVATIGGKEIEIYYSGVPIKDRDGRVIGVFEIINDQSTIKKSAKLTQKISDYQSREVNKVAEALHKLAKGNLDINLTLGECDSETLQAQQNFAIINTSFGELANAIRLMVADADILTEAALQGKFDVRADVLKHNGEFRNIIEGVNNTLDTICSYIDQTLEVLKDVDSMVTMIEKGKLNFRNDISRHKGDLAKIIIGLNNTLDTIMKPVNEAISCLQNMVDGDFTVKMEGQYEGDHSIIKNNLNKLLASMNEILEQVYIATNKVVSGAYGISDASQSLSQGATEQASSIEEITSSMTQLASQIKLNAENANQANQLTMETRRAAETGNSQMHEMVDAMHDISDASQNISRIIKVIDEIAFQTNLLALNAAVEAARAGRHGKGFAVVAEEVRNLAARSAKAAKETAELIENSIKKSENGANMADKTEQALEGILLRITKVTDLVGEIAIASNEQAQGVAQVNIGLEQIEKVTQQNTAHSEETASSSEDLTGQAFTLQDMLKKFKLTGQKHLMSAEIPHQRQISPRGGMMRQNYKPKETKIVKPNDIIALDDSEFGRY